MGNESTLVTALRDALAPVIEAAVEEQVLARLAIDEAITDGARRAIVTLREDFTRLSEKVHNVEVSVAGLHNVAAAINARVGAIEDRLEDVELRCNAMHNVTSSAAARIDTVVKAGVDFEAMCDRWTQANADKVTRANKRIDALADALADLRAKTIGAAVSFDGEASDWLANMLENGPMEGWQSTAQLRAYNALEAYVARVAQDTCGSADDGAFAQRAGAWLEMVLAPDHKSPSITQAHDALEGYLTHFVHEEAATMSAVDDAIGEAIGDLKGEIETAISNMSCAIDLS